MNWSLAAGDRVRCLQTQLFPVCATLAAKAGYLGSFLSNSLKTHQLEVNTDSKTLRPIARLKEPRELFALPKERDYDCPQQAPRWPIECQVLEERVYHLDDAPETPEPYYQPTGKELQPRPVGEENGIIVYNYNPTSAVHYLPVDDEVTQPEPEPVPCPGKGGGSVLRQLRQLRRRLQRTLLQWEASEYVDRDYSYEEMNDAGEILPYDEENQIVHQVVEESPTPDRELVAMHLRKRASAGGASSEGNVQRQVDSSTVCDREAVSSSPDSDRDGCQPLRHVDSTSSTNNDNNNNNNNNSDESDDSDGEQTGSSPAVPASMTKTTTNRTPDLCPQFSRSTVGGSKAQPAAHPTPLDPDDLVFESRFESGNLGRAIKITPTYYELYLRPDMYTNRHTQWFYFQVKNTKAKVVYRFSIINLTKPDSLYKEGMRPLMYSTMDAECNQVGWRRCGDNIAYFRNEDNSHYHHRPADDDEDEYIGTSSFTLSFNIEFKYDGDTVYFAHSYPYTYSDLQDYLMCIQRNPVKSKFCKLRLLCRSLAGNNVYYLTVTAPTTHEDDNQKKKKAVIITARVHPGESPSSWMMKGLMDFITGDSYVAKKLRHKFIFKLVPMLNPDGVIVGNTRSSLTGRDLNRQYRTVIRETYPSIWNTKAMIRRLMEDCGVAMYCDMHAHSRKHNVFIYGCENLKRHPDRRLLEQVFPLMLHKNVADKFSFENCKFKVQKNKEGTGRIVVWVLGVTNSYTLEASFGGSTMGGRAGTHFSTADYEHIGRAYCETLMDYYDDNPIKEKLRMKILTRLSKEGSSAEEPLNIPLSDYSSDEGDTSSSSSEDEGKDSMAELEGPCCSTLKVPPSSPVLPQKLKGNKKSKKQSVPLARPPTYRRKSHSVQRIVLDIPTTEPASDFFEYTSEDELLLPPAAASDTENTVKRTFRRRNRPRRTDNIRKLTLLGCETQYLMPPELIVRSAANRYQSEDEDEQSKMVMSIIKEFPPVLGKERVWQRSSGSERTVEVMKSASPDHCQVRFSLKRSIWTGTHSDGYVNDCYNPRPISWGAPPTLVKSTHYDNEALLTACSQKLAAWKDEKRSMKEKHHKSLLKHHSHVLGAHKDKENRSVRVKITVGSEQYATAAAAAAAAAANGTAGGKHKLPGDKKASDQTPDGGPAGGGGGGSSISRVKRKTRSTLSKIVEKAEIITHLSRSARVGQSRRLLTTSSSLSTAGSPRKALLSVPSTAGPLSAGPNGTGNGGAPDRPNGVPSPGVKPGSKFRTGGIVVTAAQPLPKMRKAYAGPRGKSTASPIKLPTTSIDIQLTTLCSETESERNVKVITGKKHKKKRTAKEKKDKLPC
ncbi:cytosolic carboxypeptidase 2 isoform X2 [Anopheles gambiae]|uniref:cytosolic carboxypeptidase 2 isoform X2 n=1 Tax=Anopheles gambiae TaxID=7165 RepID=UPI002AC8C9D5|nr:cytosolic carboxypeptidase 2 isoform X2 [Anopheles gambiae]